MKLIELSQGKFAKVDDELYEFLNQWKWYFDGKYARRNIKLAGRIKHILMHRLIAGTPDGTFTDHVDGNMLNNQSSNLRHCNRGQNAANMKHRDHSSYKGVSRHKTYFRTQIWQNNERVFSALFPNERWAAMAYDLNATALFGEFTRPNFPNAILVLKE